LVSMLQPGPRHLITGPSRRMIFSPSNGFALPVTFSSGAAAGAEVEILESIVMLSVSM